MKYSFFGNLKKSITLRLLTLVFSVYLFITFAVTATHMYIEYVSTKFQVEEQLSRLNDVVNKSLAEALWNFDDEQAYAAILGTVQSSTVIGARLSDVLDETLALKIGIVLNDEGEMRDFGQVYDREDFEGKAVTDYTINDILPRTFVLEYLDTANVKNILGKFTLYSTNNVVFDQVKVGFILIIVNAIVKTFTLWLFFLWAGHLYLSTPLAIMNAATKTLAAGDFNHAKIPDVPKQASGTEIDDLTASFNKMVLMLNHAEQEAKESQEKLNIANEQLLDVQHRLLGIINAMPSVLIGITHDGTITDWNTPAETLTGIKAEMAVGQSIFHIYAPFQNYLPMMMKAIQLKTLQKESKVKDEMGEEVRYYDVIAYPIAHEEITGAVIRIDDVTTRFKLEEIMAQTEKMTSVGGLAAGVAHEINNPLGSIVQGAQNILRRLDVDHTPNKKAAAKYDLDLEAMQAYMKDRNILGFIDGVLEAGKRAANIVSNLLTFTRRSTSDKYITRLEDIVDNSVNLAATDYSLKKKTDFKHIDIIKQYADNLPEVYCCPMELEQVILNLLKNAAYALDGLDRQPRIDLRIYQKNQDHIVLEVEDNGPGMSEKVRKHVLEPFFTTKPPGEGTGLGLSVSYNIIVENHKGALELDTKLNEGTKFTITLPTSNSAALAAANHTQRND